MTKLKDLAKALGLSVTQVSRALDDKPDVAAKTKVRVREEAARLGYFPNAAARSIRKQRTDTVAVVLPPGSNAVGLGALVELLHDAAIELARYGYDLVMIPGLDANNEINALQRVVDGRRADAVIVVRTRRDDERVRFLSERAVPFVTLGRTSSTEHSFVDGDGAAGFADATRLLASLGHQRIAHIAAPQVFNFAHDRRNGWAAAMVGLGYGDALIECEGEPTERGGFEAASNLLDRRVPPTALLCSTDAMAIGAYSAARARDLLPGQTISIIGHDDLAVGSLISPKLTTMKIASTEIGQRLAGHLNGLLNGVDPHTLQTLYPIRQISRGSHGPVGLV
jgi:LacI family transcriptional regulator